jgi:hypothetical protein
MYSTSGNGTQCTIERFRRLVAAKLYEKRRHTQRRVALRHYCRQRLVEATQPIHIAMVERREKGRHN